MFTIYFCRMEDINKNAEFQSGEKLLASRGAEFERSDTNMSLPLPVASVEISSSDSVMSPVSTASTEPLVLTTEPFPHTSAVAFSMLSTSIPSVYQPGKKTFCVV